ncbi:MAG: nuclear transport factor 2 family protein [Pseudomonadota bacterium]
MVRYSRYVVALALGLLALTFAGCQQLPRAADARQQVLDHGAMIRAAFARGDLDTITALHHPEVTKALGYDNVQEGRAAVVDGIAGTLAAYALEFVENDLESVLVRGDVAIEATRFAIAGTPKGDGQAFVFRGRTMVIYVRDTDSPSGWVTVREIIQPAGS